MPAISGIDFYKSLPQKIMVIFTTAYSEYAVEGFSLDAIDYLLKPFTFDRFLQAAGKAKAHHSLSQLTAAAPQTPQQPSAPQHIVLRADYSLLKITLSDILFIEGLDNYLRIHLQDQDPVLIRITMKSLLEKLPTAEFLRVHRSYIIPLGRIGNVRNKVITVAGREIPLSASYEAGFYKAFGPS